ncbi:glutamate receptor 2-like isoform X2 [Penaeus monodon]|uniref:glutamate receptor 2-like isoform X2 n=1 Tax=Penaeus monodon TaxID=6687 RepID=UPI0018A6E97A|nr:glutamate receptor 2-like isoform X2 [Penaeus monodon]
MESPEKRRDCFKVLALRWPPFIWWEGNQSPDQLGGSMKAIMDIFASHLGFCYNIVVPPGENWGNREENGSYSGMLGMMVRREVDMTIVPVGVSEERSRAMDFSEFILMDRQHLIFKRPFPEADMAGFIKPYTPWMWFLIFVAALGICGALAIVHFGYKKLLQDLHTPEEFEEADLVVVRRTLAQDLYNYVLWMFSSLILLSVPWNPRGVPVRTLTGVWLIVALIISTVYRSNLKAMLILPKVNLPFTTISEFLQTDIPLYIIEGSLADHYTKGAEPNSSLARLRAKARVNTDVIIAIKEVYMGEVTGISSFHGQTKLLHDSFTKNGYCGVYRSVDGLLGGTSNALGFPKGSPLKPKIDRMIRGLREFGILNYLLFQQVPNATNCLTVSRSSTSNLSELRPLELKDFYGVFSLYAGGLHSA